jgi:hypothetical protein
MRDATLLENVVSLLLGQSNEIVGCHLQVGC